MSNQYQGLDRFFSQIFVDSFIYYRSLLLFIDIITDPTPPPPPRCRTASPSVRATTTAPRTGMSGERWEASSYFRWKSKCSATRGAGAACSGSTATRATSRARASGRPRAGRATWPRSPRSPQSPAPAPPRAGTRGREVGTRNRTAGKIYHKCSNGFLPLCWMQK